MVAQCLTVDFVHNRDHLFMQWAGHLSDYVITIFPNFCVMTLKCLCFQFNVLVDTGSTNFAIAGALDPNVETFFISLK
jgi:hypothetical protein